MKHIFIVNPAAGKGKALKLIPEIKKIFAQRHDDFIIEQTLKPGHATEIASKYAGESLCRVYSVGGDGTLNEVLNGMAGSASSLAVIPCGSGNDFIKNIHESTDILDILRRTIDGTEKKVDIAKANDRYFINISSVGFDAEVVLNSRKYKKVPGITGSLAYILGIITTVFKYSGQHINVSIDDVKLSEKLLLTTVANGKYYGGGMMPAPEAKIDDGLLDICLIKTLSKIKVLAFFPKLIKGTHGIMKEVRFYKGKRIEISSDGEISINMDGEVTRGNKVVFEIVAAGVNIVIPCK